MFQDGVSQGYDNILFDKISTIGRHARVFKTETNHMQCTPMMPTPGTWAVDVEELFVIKERAMGWFSCYDNMSPRDLYFDSLEQAIHFCKREGLSFQVEVPREKKLELKSYAHNFLWKGEPEVDSEDLED